MPRPKRTDPRILEMPDRTVAVVRTTGEPNEVVQSALGALHGSVYTLKFARKKAGLEDFKIGAPVARWLDPLETPRDQWRAIWAIAIPDDVTEVPQREPAVEVTVERLEYGTVAEILHIGPYSEEGPTVERLHQFIQESGYVIAGSHEEEYLTKPDAKEVRTIIRYQVQRA